jgi:hypothetical protein
MVTIRQALLATLILPLASLTFAGNQELMEREKARAFLLSRQVVNKLGAVPENASISLRGRVKQLPNGRLEVVIDDLEIKNGIEKGSFPFDSGTQPADAVEYVIFEEIPRTEHSGH